MVVELVKINVLGKVKFCQKIRKVDVDVIVLVISVWVGRVAVDFICLGHLLVDERLEFSFLARSFRVRDRAIQIDIARISFIIAMNKIDIVLAVLGQKLEEVGTGEGHLGRYFDAHSH